MRDWLWTNQTPGRRTQPVSTRYRDVLAALLALGAKYGKVYPKKETLALMARCSVRTVGNALRWLRLYGFLDWQRRARRVAAGVRVIVRQSSNAYRFTLGTLSKTIAAHECRDKRQQQP